jgi:hypothetical protein
MNKNLIITNAEYQASLSVQGMTGIARHRAR